MNKKRPVKSHFAEMTDTEFARELSDPAPNEREEADMLPPDDEDLYFPKFDDDKEEL